MFRTHLAIAVLAGIFILQKVKPSNSITFLIAFCIATLMPDIDYGKSWIGRRTRPLSSLLNLVFGHRGFLHTVYPPLAFFAFSTLFGLFWIGVAFLLGYLVHLFADCLTLEGVRLFSPFSKFRVKGFVRTGGLLESAVLFFSIVLILLQIGFLSFFG